MPDTGASKITPTASSGATALSAELTFDEMLRARQVFVMHTEEYISTPFELRTVLSELGQYPQDAELNFCVEAFGNKMTFNDFTSYLSFLKKRFMKPEPQDVDTLRAFVALGGGSDRRGDINAENLRNACRHFDLTIDIDAMIREVDDDNSGKLEFNEFKSMWTAPEGNPVEAAAVPAEDGSLDVEDSTLSGTLRSASAAAAARAAAAAGIKPEDEPPVEEDTIELLKLHLFPTMGKKTDGVARKGAKRTSMLPATQARIPVVPLRGEALASQSGTAGGNTEKPSGKDAHSDSDSDDGDTPQAYQRSQYRPPSPVILSMRHMKAPTKTRSLQATPRSGRGGRHGSPQRTPRASGAVAVSPRR